MNKNLLFRELVKVNFNEVVQIKHIESGETATNQVYGLIEWIYDIEENFNDMFEEQHYEVKFLNEDDIERLEWEEYIECLICKHEFKDEGYANSESAVEDVCCVKCGYQLLYNVMY